MIVVLAIMSAVSGAVIGSLTTLRSTSLSVSAREFADFITLCRSEAIARRTVVRVVIVEESGTEKERNFRAYTAFAWDRRSRRFEQYKSWEHLSDDVVFEVEFPRYVKESEYYREDPSSVRGDYLMSLPENVFEKEDRNGSGVNRFRYVEFSPAGRASAPSASLRNLVLVMRPGNETSADRDVANWAQFSIDTLTGRTRVYRP
ncbi:MAG: hypothetical protein P1U81_06870 [Verrucomicrobiales bacterium]|nr:hypothetical protein [Verrucomicrobiales bacterium]